MEILEQYTDNGYLVTIYSKDGKNISHVLKEFIQQEIISPEKIEASINEKLLAEMEYQTAMLEMSLMGGE